MMHGRLPLHNVRNRVGSSRAAFIVRVRLADGRLSGAPTTRGKVRNWGGKRTLLIYGSQIACTREESNVRKNSNSHAQSGRRTIIDVVFRCRFHNRLGAL